MVITLPFWLLVLILIVIGVIGCFIISMFSSGSYDFLTPLLAVGWLLVFIVLAIGLAVGKYVF